MRTLSGLCLDPHSAWLVLQGLQTLSLRVRAQNATAARVASFLADHPVIDFVAYPDFGGVVTFGVLGDLTTFLESLSLCTLAVSLGGTKTLIEAPTLMSHVQCGPDNASLAVIPANAVRLSVGLEAAEDIISDLAHGLAGLEVPPMRGS
jgi:cystathionine beta-lyase/cystathionine gamma-synthase